MNRNFSAMMTSAVVLGSLMVGCSTGGQDRPQLTAGEPQKQEFRVERLLASKDFAGALAAAETLVAAQPQDGAARALLGRAYLANGRYLSARTAFGDALTLGNRDPRTIVSLSLAEAALGNLEGARTLLTGHIADLPAGDYGLAMAMAGDPREGVRALVEAVRAPDATAKTRQNLAYALAMAGAWAQARLIAGQDLAARDAEARVGEWARGFAQASASDRVVAMIGVTPRGDDAGLPVRLALGATPAEPVGLASAADAAPAFTPQALAAMLARMPAPRSVAPADEAEVPAVARAALEPVPAAAPAVRHGDMSLPDMRRAAFAGAPASAPAAAARPVPAVGTNWTAGLGTPATDASASDWVVQVGAYDSAAIAREKWRSISRDRDALKYYRAVHSVFQVNGRSFHRLAIRGFEDRGAAASACFALRNIGQDCFVRLDDTGTTRHARADALAKRQQVAQASQPAGRMRAAR